VFAVSNIYKIHVSQCMHFYLSYHAPTNEPFPARFIFLFLLIFSGIFARAYPYHIRAYLEMCNPQVHILSAALHLCAPAEVC